MACKLEAARRVVLRVQAPRADRYVHRPWGACGRVSRVDYRPGELFGYPCRHGGHQ